MSARHNLPTRPNIEQLKNQAKDLLSVHRSGSPEAVPRMKAHLPRLSGASDAVVLAAKFSLLDAQLVVAREYGFDNWHMLIEHVESSEHPPSPTDPDADPKTLRVEQLVRDGLMSSREAEYVLAGATKTPRGSVRSLVEDMTLAGEYTERDIEFMDAAYQRGALRSGVCDVDRMRALLVEEPSLIETAGPAALAKAVGTTGSLPAVEFLMERGVPRLTLNPFEYSELSEAVGGGNFDGLRAVFDAGYADASYIQEQMVHAGWPAHVGFLFWGRHDSAMTELLLDYGADRILDIPDAGGVTPLQHLVWDWHAGRGRDRSLSLGRLYRERGAYYDLFSACGYDDIGRVRELIEEDVSCVNACHANGSAPLHWAARQSSYACAQVLLENGADVNAVHPSLGWTPLHWATDLEVIRLLGDHGADINAQDRKGRTALHIATYDSKRALAEGLLALGPDTTVQNKSGKTAFEVARVHCAYLRPTKSGERGWPGPDVPLTIFEVFDLPGVGKKTVRTLHEQHGVQSLDDVKRMAQDGSLVEVRGISKKTFENLRGMFDLALTLEAVGVSDFSVETMWALYGVRGVRSLDDLERMLHDGSLAAPRVGGIDNRTIDAIREAFGGPLR